VTIDVGTGDGRAVLVTAAAEPMTLAIGIDANAASMAEISRRAAGPARKGGLENALFVMAAAEAPPPEFRALAHRVTVLFPWGSLLRGCLGKDASVAEGVAGLLAPDGTLELLLAPADRDGLDGLPTDPLAVIATATRTFDALGLRLIEARLATEVEVRASGSTWARRLLSNPATRRQVLAMRFAAEGVTMTGRSELVGGTRSMDHSPS
jgi:16S rRNA (adenine(1408)-N(1))-methyltransferase